MITNIEQKNAVVEIEWSSLASEYTGGGTLIPWYELQRKVSPNGTWEWIGYCPDISIDPQYVQESGIASGQNIFWDTLPNRTYSNKNIDYRVQRIDFASGDPSTYNILSTSSWSSSGISLGIVNIPNIGSINTKRPPIGFKSRFIMNVNLSARGPQGNGSPIGLRGLQGSDTWLEAYDDLFGQPASWDAASGLNGMTMRPWGNRYLDDQGASGLGITLGKKNTGNKAFGNSQLMLPWEANKDGLFTNINGTGFMETFVNDTKTLLDGSGLPNMVYLLPPTFRSNQQRDSIFNWANLGPTLATNQMMLFDTLSLTKPTEMFTNISSPLKTMMEISETSGFPMFGEPATQGEAVNNGWFDYTNYHSIASDSLMGLNEAAINEYPDRAFIFILDANSVRNSELPNNGAGMTDEERIALRASQIFGNYPENVFVTAGLQVKIEGMGSGVVSQLIASGSFGSSTPLRPAYNISYSNGSLSWSEGSGYYGRDLYFVKESGNESDNVYIENYSSTSIDDNLLGKYLENGSYKFEVWSKGVNGNVRNFGFDLVFNNTSILSDGVSKINVNKNKNVVTSSVKGNSGIGSNLSTVSNSLSPTDNFKQIDRVEPKGSILNVTNNTYVRETQGKVTTYGQDDAVEKTELVYREPTRVRVSGV